MYLRKVQRWKAIEIARTQEIELSKRYPLDIPGLRRLAVIDECLSGFCDLNGKHDEARSLREESIGCWEACLALNPGDMEIRQQLLAATEKLLPFLVDSKDEHSYERWNGRAIAMLEGLKSPYTNHVGAALELSRQHRFRANSLMAHGESDRARKELEDDLNLIRSESVAGTASPAFVLSEALTLAALGQWSGEFALPRSPIQSQPTNVEFNDLELGLAELTARRIGWLPSIVKSSWLIPEELPTEAWVDRIISSIKSDATAFNLDHTRIPAIAWTMREPCYSKLAWQRRFGKRGDALRGADQLLALAERLTQSYPDQAAAYMLLSEGYVQRAKIAYRVDDEPVIEWERKALEAAIHAETLAPDNDEARGLVKVRRARLHKLASK